MAFELIRAQLDFFPPRPKTLERKLKQVHRAGEHGGLRFVQFLKTGDPGKPLSSSASEWLVKRQVNLEEALAIVQNRQEQTDRREMRRLARQAAR